MNQHPPSLAGKQPLSRASMKPTERPAGFYDCQPPAPQGSSALHPKSISGCSREFHSRGLAGCSSTCQSWRSAFCFWFWRIPPQLGRRNTTSVFKVSRRIILQGQKELSTGKGLPDLALSRSLGFTHYLLPDGTTFTDREYCLAASDVCPRHLHETNPVWCQSHQPRMNSSASLHKIF